MAINTNPEDSSACSSPRLSFSRDLPDENTKGTKTHQEDDDQLIGIISPTSSDFMFCVPGDDNELSCPADELFFNGVIIPTQMRDKINNESLKEEQELNEEITSTTKATLVREEKNQSKSFWRFRRSSSLNCNDNYGPNKKSSIWSLPLLFRSKSTGSTSKLATSSSHSKSMKSSSNNCSNVLLPPPHHQKGQVLRKSSTGNNGYYSNNHNHNNHNHNNNSYNCYVRNSPVLNVPPPYIAKGTSDLLGFGGWFRSNGSKQDKRSRKV